MESGIIFILKNVIGHVSVKKKGRECNIYIRWAKSELTEEKIDFLLLQLFETGWFFYQ